MGNELKKSKKKLNFLNFIGNELSDLIEPTCKFYEFNCCYCNETVSRSRRREELRGVAARGWRQQQRRRRRRRSARCCWIVVNKVQYERHLPVRWPSGCLQLDTNKQFAKDSRIKSAVTVAVES